LLSSGFGAASNEIPGLAKQRVRVSTCIARCARNEASRQHWNNEFVAILFTRLFVRVMFMRRMRDLADVKLRQEYENKCLDKRNENT
jgi:hypothetical protein